jgi:hypothetical protein
MHDFPERIDCFCGAVAFKIISMVQNVRPDWEPYFDENLDTMVEGRGHRRELMKQNGLDEKYIDPTIIRLRKEEREHNKREEIKDGRR